MCQGSDYLNVINIWARQNQVREVKEKRNYRKPKSQAKSRVTVDDVLYSGHSQPTQYVTRSGHTVKKLVRLIQDFQEDIHEGPSLKGRGSCEKSRDNMDNREGSCKNPRSQSSRELQRSCSLTQPEVT